MLSHNQPEWNERGFTIRAIPHPYGGLTFEIDLGGNKSAITPRRFINLDALRAAASIALAGLLDPFRVRYAQ